MVNEKLSQVLNTAEYILLDMDGTLYLGNRPYRKEKV